MKREGIKVSVSAGISKADNCHCDMCGALARVIKACIPRTLYYDHMKLSAKYSEWWMCERCRDRFVYAISIPFPREESEEV